MTDKRRVHLYWRTLGDKPMKVHAHMDGALRLLKTRPNMFSVDGKFVGERRVVSEHEMRAAAKSTSRMRPHWHPW
jgi:hypothetical protein